MTRSFLSLLLVFLMGSAVQADYLGTVYTPNGSAVTVIVTTYELSSAQRASNDNYVATNYPNATLLRSSTRRYNCHSYAWYSTSSSNTRWMDTPGDDTYWNDGSYTYTNSPGYNAKASYVYGDHSAIYKGSSMMYSKWGQLGLVYHHYAYCPYWGGVNIINYYQ